ncbi:MAG TPA: DUF2156 domain-containing protein, partial [Oceanospirillales bacterium]|nr:DUF2156 domain-containing protein [Oceanospirillales bacterium]
EEALPTLTTEAENDNALATATIDFLAQMIADETRRDRDSIAENSTFDSFGIDSFLAMRMTKKLEKIVGSVSKTVFFEHNTLESLSAYLIAEHGDALAQSFKLEDQADVKVTKVVQTATQASNDKALQVATIDYLAEMIATETRRDKDSIAADSGFETFGIDSFLAMRMTKKLEKLVGSVSKTVFFEHSTLDSLSAYLIAEHGEALAQSLEFEPKTDTTVVEVEDTSKQVSAGNALQAATIDYLAQMIATETRRDRDSIAADSDFDTFGIDSFLAMRMTKKLEKIVGSVTKTVFFEHKNLTSLTDYLLQEHGAALSTAFAIESASAPIETQDGSHALREATLDYLTQMIATETRRDRDSISADSSFDAYGIDSFLAMRMTKKLEKIIGSVAKTVFFEHTNLDSLTDYLLLEHGDALAQHFAIDFKITQTQTVIAASIAGHEPQGAEVVISKLIKGKPMVLKEEEVIADREIQTLLDNLCRQYGTENKALARNAIAPLIFLAANRKAYFNFNHNGEVALAFTYVGAESELQTLALEFSRYCQAQNLQANMLTEKPLGIVEGLSFSSNPFGVMQRMMDIENVTLQGSKMRRLRYQLKKFEQSGQCQFLEYKNGIDQRVDKSIASMIDQWADTKTMINPYIWQVKDLIIKGQLPRQHRIFLTTSDKQLQNVIIITKLASGNGYLMDLEFYAKTMPLGGLEYSIWNILQTLSEEGSHTFSLGATFGISEGDESHANSEVTQVLRDLQKQGAFDGQGNLQFKNKFRPQNTTLFLSRPATDDPAKVLDVIMMIANPVAENDVSQSQG